MLFFVFLSSLIRRLGCCGESSHTAICGCLRGSSTHHGVQITTLGRRPLTAHRISLERILVRSTDRAYPLVLTRCENRPRFGQSVFHTFDDRVIFLVAFRDIHCGRGSLWDGSGFVVEVHVVLHELHPHPVWRREAEPAAR